MVELYSRKQDCCGCSACMSICPQNAISMQNDIEGFLYPNINHNLCIECGLCVKTCPFHDCFTIEESLFEPDIYAAKHKSDSVRFSSSSGGMFTAISDFIINHNGVIYGAGFDKNFKLCHQSVTTIEDREKLKGSKYIQSDLKQTFKEVKNDLRSGKYVLFTGTPCQTAGLYSYLKNKINSDKLYMCDIVCHGAPSPLMWKEYVGFLENKNKDKIKSVEFRNKVLGWHIGTLRVVMYKTEYSKNWFTDYYYYLFFGHNILRPSCHICKFTNLHRPSDITIGDFWGIEKCKPCFDDNKGVSLVLINTAKGRDLLNNISKNLILEESNSVECLQPNLQNPSKASLNRDKLWNDYYRKGFLYVIKKYARDSTITKIKNKTKEMIRRVLFNLKLLGLAKKILHRKVY